jgi:hypothetical protein
MKLVFTTKKKDKEKTYLIRLPNYYDIEKVNDLLSEVKYDLPSDEVITTHHFYGDNMPTLDERKQIDIHGEVIDPPTELKVEL